MKSSLDRCNERCAARSSCNPARARSVQLAMFNLGTAVANASRLRSRLSVVALTLGCALACERVPERTSDEGSLQLVSMGRSHAGGRDFARGTVTVRGLNDGLVHVVSTSTEAGVRELRLAPGLYSVGLAMDFDVEWLEHALQSEPSKPASLVALPQVVRVGSGDTIRVRIDFDSGHQRPNALASHAAEQTRAAADYQDVAGSSSERTLICRPTGNGCDPVSAADVPLPERRALDRKLR